MRDPFVYTGCHTNQISFPLGGLGTGCIGLAGNGRLIDWEIFNRPGKGRIHGFSHFAIKAEIGGVVRDARVLHGDLPAPYTGDLHAPHFRSFGHGPRREYLSGLPHFDSVDFHGTFPLAELAFSSARFPGQVRLKAFNPLIPLNDRDSGIPAAFFEYEVTNTTAERMTYTLAGVLANPAAEGATNRVRQEEGWTHLELGNDALSPDDPAFGTLTLATDASEVSWQHDWFRGAWFDSLEVYWHDLTTPGPFKDRRYEPEPERGGVTTFRGSAEGVMAAHRTLAPGETGSMRFVISWHFPTCENYWNEAARASACAAGLKPTWKNYYATLWPDSASSARYALENWDRLYRETERFRNALFGSSLPAPALDAVTANISILKTATVLRLEDGTFYGWEGVHVNAGSCEGSCTHVWNYAQALPFLFPALERSMRSADYRYNLRPDGGMLFRLMLPLGTPPEGVVHRPCADGQFGGVMKTYRDWKISGDDAWLRGLWPALKASIAFAWHPDNEDRWDPEKTGVLWGRQHHTLDMELFGPNAWLTGFYLGALKAGAEMAAYLGEAETAAEYRTIFARGKAWMDEHLFNGAYYQQRLELGDRGVLEAFDTGSAALGGGSALGAYWNSEHEEIKYQIAEGCIIDQLLAQWHANLYGLGEIFDAGQAKVAVASLFQNNFKTSSRDTYNPCRVYSLNDEAGLIICTWPEGREKPLIPVPYAQETMNGFEYAAASLMLQTGLVREGETAISAVRRRYDGERRNPWNEIECGSNYARSMASYAFLLDYAGFSFDMPQQRLGFAPLEAGDVSFFWCLEGAWGTFERQGDEHCLEVLYGKLELKTFSLPQINAVREVRQGESPLAATLQDGSLEFAEPVQLRAGEALRIF